MNTGNARIRAAIIAALALLAPAAGRGDDPPAPVALFDGKTLEGWKAVTSYQAGEVKAQGGSIVLGQGGPMTAVACTRPALPTTDYELSFEARRVAGEDFFAAATFPVGASFLTLVNGGWGGGVTGLSSIDGADASENETNRFVKYRNGTWYRFRIRVTGKAVRCSVDDREIIALRHDGRHLKTRVEVRGCQPLGFASWRGSGEIRAITVRALTAAEVEAAGQIPEVD
ncbi:family 16 glycoside hydrolase [Tundrisphaera sp. TA3]|uniref:family 16 glycoside hydrolase n=1 Tax=Tundrisphaera sp. TA3 TaxID=3435775 RepID=UPI003EBA2B55